METLQKQILFWDIDLHDLDPQRHQKFIIERILNRGEIEDFKWAVQFYGEETVKNVLIKSRKLDAKSLNFWCHYFNIDPKQCTKKSSTNRHFKF